jgi:NTE family protein
LVIMLDELLDIFRLRQYFNVITRTREWVAGLRDDAAFLTDAGRAALHLSPGAEGQTTYPFAAMEPFEPAIGEGQRIALAATGGSGAMASMVGVARALEEAGLRPSVVSLCSGSALFGFPIAAGIDAAELAAFTMRLRPEDYIDVDWWRLLRLAPTVGRGFAGILGAMPSRRPTGACSAT